MVSNIVAGTGAHHKHSFLHFCDLGIKKDGYMTMKGETLWCVA